MIVIGLLPLRMLCDCFKSQQRLEAQILVLRHQLNVLRQHTPRRRLHLRWADRTLFIWLYRRYPRVLDAITIIRPETVVRWHRKGFAAYWRWKSRSPGGRPRIAREVRDLIRRMSLENPLWGATKMHGELLKLKLGIQVAQSTVSNYMVPRRGRPLQSWKTFMHNHAEGIAWIHLFVVPTIAFQQLFAFLVLGHKRRQLLWFAVTRNPTAGWWEQLPPFTNPSGPAVAANDASTVAPLQSTPTRAAPWRRQDAGRRSEARPASHRQSIRRAPLRQADP
jgi:hypothetical protein